MIDNLLTCDETISKMITEEKSRPAQRTEGTEETKGIFDELTGWKTIDKNEPPSFDKLFKFTTNYLNGKNGTDQFNNQCLIVTVAGGNPIKIFFYILAYLHNKGNSSLDVIDVIIAKFYKHINNDEHSSAKAKLKDILTNLKIFLNLTLIESEIKSIKEEKLNNLAKTLDFTAAVIKMELDKRINDILNFELQSSLDEIELINIISDKKKTFVVISESKISEIQEDNNIILPKFPIKVFNLIEKINIILLKKNFITQSKININAI